MQFDAAILYSVRKFNPSSQRTPPPCARKRRVKVTDLNDLIERLEKADETTQYQIMTEVVRALRMGVGLHHGPTRQLGRAVQSDSAIYTGNRSGLNLLANCLGRVLVRSIVFA